MSLFKLEWQRAWRSKGIWIALGIGSLIAILHFMLFVFPYFDYINTENFIDQSSVFSIWLGGEWISDYPMVYYGLMPVLIVLPAAGSYRSDLKTGYIKQILTRSTRKKYMTAKYLVTFVTGGLVAVLPLILNFLLSSTLIPATLPHSGTRNFSIFSYHLWGNLFYKHPFGYVFLYLLLDFFFFGLLATAALTVMQFRIHTINAMLSPLLLCLVLYVISPLVGVFLEASKYTESYLYMLCPLYYLRPSQPAVACVPVIVGEAAGLLLLGAVYFRLGKKETYQKLDLCALELEYGKIYILQENRVKAPVFLPEFSAFENLALLASIKKEVFETEIKKAMEMAGLDPADESKYRSFSAEKKQRLGIACALMESRRTVVFHEPLKEFGYSGREMIQELIFRLKEEGKRVILIAQNQEEYWNLADEAVILKGEREVENEACQSKEE